jgi:malate synthase
VRFFSAATQGICRGALVHHVLLHKMDIHTTSLMEDRATLRISQANILPTGCCSGERGAVNETFQRMAAVVD